MSHKFPLSLDRPLAFIDLETTGLNRTQDRIVELAVLIFYPDGRTLDRVRRFNPEMPVPPEATAVHGISDADVAAEEPFRRRARSLAQLLDDCDMGGFNIRSFDLPLLVEEFKRAGIPFALEGRRLIDVQVIFHHQERRDLEAAARFYLEDAHAGAHSARADVRITARVLEAQLSRYPDLPSSISGLHQYCDEVRPVKTEFERWFSGEAMDEYVFCRGKHRGQRLVEVARESPDYLDWMMRADDMPEKVLEIVGRVRAAG